MIIRLHVMYRRSRKMLIFLIAIFLALTIASGVILAIMTSHASSGELQLRLKDFSATAYGMNTRRVHPLRHLHVPFCGLQFTPECRDVDPWNHMGGPCTVSCS